MFDFIRKMIAPTLCLVALLVLPGCDSTPTTYSIKAYSGGEVVGNFEAASYGSGEGRIYANLANGRKHAIGGTFSVHRTDPGAANNTARATKYVAQLYSGGKVVETVNASSYSGGDGKVFLTVSNSAQVIYGGTYVLRNIGANVDGISDGAKYKVTVYSDGVLIGTWHADSYTTGDDKISLRVNGISDALIIGGDYVVEQFR